MTALDTARVLWEKAMARQLAHVVTASGRAVEEIAASSGMSAVYLRELMGETPRGIWRVAEVSELIVLGAVLDCHLTDFLPTEATGALLESLPGPRKEEEDVYE